MCRVGSIERSGGVHVLEVGCGGLIVMWRGGYFTACKR